MTAIPVFRRAPQRSMRVGLVGLSGIVTNEIALAILVSGFGAPYLAGAFIATQYSTLWNFALGEVAGPPDEGWGAGSWRRYAPHLAVNTAALVIRLPVLALLVSGLGWNYLVANVASLAVVIAIRLVFADRLWPVRTATALDPVVLDVRLPAGRNLLATVVGRVSGGGARIYRFIRFSMVGASGILVNETALAIMVRGFGLHYVVGVLLATEFSTFWNFCLLEAWAFKQHSHRNRRWQRYGMLVVVNNVANVLTLPLLIVCTSVLGINYLISNFFTLVVVIIGRFALADWIWSPAEPARRGAE
jgi:putative flippase GtrA